MAANKWFHGLQRHLGYWSSSLFARPVVFYKFESGKTTKSNENLLLSFEHKVIGTRLVDKQGDIDETIYRYT